MGVVSVVLLVLAVFIKIFDLVDARISAREAQALASAAENAQLSEQPSPAAALQEPGDAETAAAIGVALALADEELGKPETAASSPKQPMTSGNWVSTGRSRAMSGRILGPPRRGLRDL